MPKLLRRLATLELSIAVPPGEGSLRHSVEALMPVRDLAFHVAVFYLGADLLTELEGDRLGVERLFATASRLAPLSAPVLEMEAGER